MNLWEGVVIAVTAVWANKLRSFLTLLGNIIAVTFIIAVVAGIRGINEQVTSELGSKGADVFTLGQFGMIMSRQEWLKAQRNPTLTIEDADELRARVHLATHVAVRSMVGTSVWRRTKKLSTTVIGRSPEYVFINPATLAAGRHLAPFDDARKRSVAVLGADVAQELFGSEPPVTKRILIEGRPFEVIGVGAPEGTSFGSSQDNWVVMPLGTMLGMYGARRSVRIDVKVATPDRLAEAIDETTTIMRRRHRLRPSQPDDFAVTTADAMISLYHGATNTIYTALVGVVALALVVGGIVIANIMLAVVNERIREIGVRKAIGARRRDILWQFLVESTTLSVLGGALGIGTGAVLAYVIRSLTPLPTRVEPWSVGAALVLVVVVGVLAGLGPALRASQLNPVDALRYE